MTEDNELLTSNSHPCKHRCGYFLRDMTSPQLGEDRHIVGDGVASAIAPARVHNGKEAAVYEVGLIVIEQTRDIRVDEVCPILVQ